MELGEPDASGRRRPVQVPNSEFLFACDWVISAIGQEPDLAGLENATLGPITVTKWKSIQADPETFLTSAPGVFAGGDAMTGPAAAIDAIGGGRKAAWVIDRYLQTGQVEKFQAGFVSKRASLAPLDESFFRQFEKTTRESMPKLEGRERIHHWEEVDLGVNALQVKHETSRCLSCGCTSVFDCDLKVFAGNYDAKQEHYKGRLRKHKLDDRHPYILLDSNKCILCGRCVRYCGELIGVHALGFINRGYETVVKPALDKPLRETTCIACGNCIEESVPPAPSPSTRPWTSPDRFAPCRTARSAPSAAWAARSTSTIPAGISSSSRPSRPTRSPRGNSAPRAGSARPTSDPRPPLYLYRQGDRSVGWPTPPRRLPRTRRIRDTHGPDAILFLTSPRVSTEAAWLSLLASSAARFVSGGRPEAHGAAGCGLSGTTSRRPSRTTSARTWW
jgi:ferredoxin